MYPERVCRYAYVSVVITTGISGPAENRYRTCFLLRSDKKVRRVISELTNASLDKRAKDW